MKKILALFAALSVSMLCMASACSTDVGAKVLPPVSSAYSVQQNAYVVMRAYADATVEATKLVEATTTPAPVKTILATAVLNTAGPAKAVNAAFAAYDAKQAIIKAMTDAGQSVPEALLIEAGDLYLTAKKLYTDHEADLTSFPGLITAIKNGAAAK